MSSYAMPSAKHARMNDAERRVPRIVGFPPRRSGFVPRYRNPGTGVSSMSSLLGQPRSPPRSPIQTEVYVSRGPGPDVLRSRPAPAGKFGAVVRSNSPDDAPDDEGSAMTKREVCAVVRIGAGATLTRTFPRRALQCISSRTLTVYRIPHKELPVSPTDLWPLAPRTVADHFCPFARLVS